MQMVMVVGVCVSVCVFVCGLSGLFFKIQVMALFQMFASSPPTSSFWLNCIE